MKIKHSTVFRNIIEHDVLWLISGQSSSLLKKTTEFLMFGLKNCRSFSIFHSTKKCKVVLNFPHCTKHNTKTSIFCTFLQMIEQLFAHE